MTVPFIAFKNEALKPNSTKSTTAVDGSFPANIKKYMEEARKESKIPTPKPEERKSTKPSQASEQKYNVSNAKTVKQAPAEVITDKEEYSSNTIQDNNMEQVDTNINMEQESVEVTDIITDIDESLLLPISLDNLEAPTTEISILPATIDQNDTQENITDKTFDATLNTIETTKAVQSPELIQLIEIQDSENRAMSPASDTYEEDLDGDVVEQDNNANIIPNATILPQTKEQLQVINPATTEEAEEIISSINQIDKKGNDKTSNEKSISNSEASVKQDTPVVPAQSEEPINNTKVGSVASQTSAEIQQPDAPTLATTLAAPTPTDRNSKGEQLKASKQSNQSDEFAIIDSVSVETIPGTENTGTEMSTNLNQQKKEGSLELSASEDKLSDIMETTERGDIALKLADDQKISVDAPMIQDKDMESVSNQIKTAIQNITNVNGKKITINLTPETLGRIEIEVTVQSGKIVSIKIEAAKQETVTILEKNSQMLQETLKEVTGGNESSLSFNLKEGNHGSSEQQKSTKQDALFSKDFANNEGTVDGEAGSRVTGATSDGLYL